MKEALARALYSTLLRAATPLYLLRLWRRGAREPAYRQFWGERLGIYRGAAPPGGWVWLHAVSLGETLAARPLVEALRESLPGMRLLLTCGTATGREAGAGLLRDGDRQSWLPYDTPGAARRFLRRFRPAVGVLMETEVWPNLLHAARRQGVPMVLANARLSPKSLAKGRRSAWLLGPAVASFERVLAQTPADAERLRAMGAGPVEVSGNLKFDIDPAPALLERGRAWRQAIDEAGPRAVVALANSRDGEELMLMAAWRALPAPRPLLLVVPRHPQRFDAVARLIEAAGFDLARRSGWGERPGEAACRAEVWLGDSMGEMPLYYACADAALLGGSFENLGGHNLIEAAACACPVVMGPHTFNFADAAELALGAGAALRVADMAEGVQRAAALAADPERRDWADRALGFAAAHRGATQRMARRIEEIVRRSGLAEHPGA